MIRRSFHEMSGWPRAGSCWPEKEFTRLRDALNAERRRLPMTEIDKQYAFEGRNGKASLLDLFEGRGQLLIYHFMFDPDWDEGCQSCSFLADGIGHPAHLHAAPRAPGGCFWPSRCAADGRHAIGREGRSLPEVRGVRLRTLLPAPGPVLAGRRLARTCRQAGVRRRGTRSIRRKGCRAVR